MDKSKGRKVSRKKEKVKEKLAQNRIYKQGKKKSEIKNVY
jgi:hypothetical protein